MYNNRIISAKMTEIKEEHGMGKLDQRIAIVTGGSTGIGRNIAMEFAKEGAKVVIGSRNVPNLEKAVEEIKVLGGHCVGISTDVSVAEQVRNLAKQTVNNFGRIDILVNNAGICHSATLLEMTEEYWDEVLDVNLKGVFLCTQAVAGYMVKQKYGKIINISSNSGRGGGLDDYANYCVSNDRGAVHGITSGITTKKRIISSQNIPEISISMSNISNPKYLFWNAPKKLLRNLGLILSRL